MSSTNTDLTLKFSCTVTPDGTTLKFVETTDVYGASNTGGYGTINPEPSDITSVALEIVCQEKEYSFDDSDLTGFPDDTATEVVNITSDMIGQDTGEQIPSGILTITFNYTGTYAGVVFTTETVIYKGIAISEECCYDKLIASVTAGSCNCESQEEGMKNVVLLRATIDAFYNAAACNDTARAEELLSQAQQICNDCECNCD